MSIEVEGITVGEPEFIIGLGELVGISRNLEGEDIEREA